ncbi:MAG: TIGR04086 family membrane protein [Tissierellia bacterium]|nr:TIGR04086 family membrane protein [Tissierellia bacterium]
MKSKGLVGVIHILKSLGLALCSTLILLFIVSILLTYTPLKESTMPTINTIIMIISITIGSIYVAIKVEEKGWINGGIIGGLYFIILLLLNYLFIKPFQMDIYTLGKFIVALITGIIGGMIGINMK